MSKTLYICGQITKLHVISFKLPYKLEAERALHTFFFLHPLILKIAHIFARTGNSLFGNFGNARATKFSFRKIKWTLKLIFFCYCKEQLPKYKLEIKIILTFFVMIPEGAKLFLLCTMKNYFF